MDPQASLTDGYEPFYRLFDSPLMRQIRREAYGEDVGQHSWVSAAELREDVLRLELTPASRLLDLGCGPCGPLTFILAMVGCAGTGVDLSGSALRVGQTRAATLGVGALLSVQVADLNEPLPFSSGSFDAAMSLDAVLHLRDRPAFFKEVARVLTPSGKLLLTDAGVVTGAISSEEVRSRSAHGYTQLVPPSWNERQLAAAGYRVLETEDRTASLIRNASGRLAALRLHRAELEEATGAAEVEKEVAYLDTVVRVSRRSALSRMMYLAEVPHHA
jgi:cyclopropane fatty-acyl-phospholipid synthase-like methyltransferase